MEKFLVKISGFGIFARYFEARERIREKKKKSQETNRSDHGSVSNKVFSRRFSLSPLSWKAYSSFSNSHSEMCRHERFEHVDSYVFPFHRISPITRVIFLPFLFSHRMV